MLQTVSIVTASHKRPLLIERAYESLLRQTHVNWEWLVVIDGDDSMYPGNAPYRKDRRVKYICNKQTPGKGPTRNLGISNATGNWIGFLDDDDEYLPDHLETLIKETEKHPTKKGIFRSQILIQRADDSRKIARSQIKSEDKWIKYLFMITNISPWIVPAESAKGTLFTDDPVFQDGRYFLELALDLPIIEINKPTAVYHFYGASGSARLRFSSDYQLVLNQELKAIDGLFSIDHPKIAFYNTNGIKKLARSLKIIDYAISVIDSNTIELSIRALKESNSWTIYLAILKLFVIKMEDKIPFLNSIRNKIRVRR